MFTTTLLGSYLATQVVAVSFDLLLLTLNMPKKEQQAVKLGPAVYRR